jgi:hypothetical protein
MALEANLETSSSRVEEGKEAGDNYTQEMEDITNTILDETDGNEVSLGGMVQAQIEMTEAETKYQVHKGLPQNVSNMNKEVGKKINQAAG